MTDLNQKHQRDTAKKQQWNTVAICALIVVICVLLVYNLGTTPKKANRWEYLGIWCLLVASAGMVFELNTKGKKIKAEISSSDKLE